MAGTITMSGLASGIDVGSMIDALVSARGTQQTAIKYRISATQSASSAISDVGSLLGKLKTSVDALSEPREAQGFSATSSDTAVKAAVTGAAGTGRYEVSVSQLAQSYRSYSSAYDSAKTELGEYGAMNIQVGAGEPGIVMVETTDTLNSLVEKINNASLGVRASTFYDGSKYRLQLAGENSGAENVVDVTGVDLGLKANLKQQAQDAKLTIDNFEVTSHSNQISAAIPGVTLNLNQKTTAPAVIELASDPDALKTKLQTVVDAYNAVVNKVHTVAGFGATKASNTSLAGDATLRNLTAKMSSTSRTVVETGTDYKTLASIGISVARDGTMSLDGTKLSKALSANPEAVTKILAGTSTSDGIMDGMSSVADLFNRSNTGLLANKRSTLDSSLKKLQARADAQQEQLDNYRTQLEKQFSVMEDAYSNANTVSAYLAAMSANGNSKG